MRLLILDTRLPCLVDELRASAAAIIDTSYF